MDNSEDESNLSYTFECDESLKGIINEQDKPINIIHESASQWPS